MTQKYGCKLLPNGPVTQASRPVWELWRPSKDLSLNLSLFSWNRVIFLEYITHYLYLTGELTWPLCLSGNIFCGLKIPHLWNSTMMITCCKLWHVHWLPSNFKRQVYTQSIVDLIIKHILTFCKKQWLSISMYNPYKI